MSVRRRQLPRAAAAALLAGLAAPALLRAQPSGGTSLPSDSAASGVLRYKGLTLTPVGFVAAEAFYRSRALTADVASAFNAVPFTHTAQGQTSEFRASARQSRLGALAEGRVGRTALSGYAESDFQSAGTTSNSNESNSYTLRLRQFWAQAAFANGVALAAGQMWSLLTPYRAGLAPRAEYLPATIDAQYAVGFDWARQLGFRVTYRAGKSGWVALAVEEPQTTFSSRGATDRPFLVGQPGGSALNQLTNYSYDAGPDLLGKVVIDRGAGHYEVKAVGRVFRDRVYTPGLGGSVQRAANYSTLGGGVGADAFWGLAKRRVEVGAHGLWGRGIGRYGSSQLPDATARADGRIVPIRAAHALGTLEVHPDPKLDVYAYGGVEYADRTADVTASRAGVGYGSPLVDNTRCDSELVPAGPFAPAAGPCNADTRAVYQGVLGSWYRFYRGPRGTVQWGVQYSHTSRNTWSSAGGGAAQPRATDNMVFTSFRYYLP